MLNVDCHTLCLPNHEMLLCAFTDASICKMPVLINDVAYSSCHTRDSSDTSLLGRCGSGNCWCRSQNSLPPRDPLSQACTGILMLLSWSIRVCDQNAHLRAFMPLFLCCHRYAANISAFSSASRSAHHRQQHHTHGNLPHNISYLPRLHNLPASERIKSAATLLIAHDRLLEIQPTPTFTTDIAAATERKSNTTHSKTCVHRVLLPC